MSAKHDNRMRRARRGRMRMRRLGAHRLCVHRTPRHIYAQLIVPQGDRVIAAASTLEPALRGADSGNKRGAEQVGQLIAERALVAGVAEVAFDRSGYRYHGRVSALADAARKAGLRF